MTTAQKAGAGLIATALTVVGLALLPGPVLMGQDGGLLPDAAWVQLPADGGNVLVSCYVGPTALSSYCVLATPTGYVEQGVLMVQPDGGMLLGSLKAQPSCVCADDSGTCLFADGGPVPQTGTYDPKVYGAMTGAGCHARACMEIGGFSGAPQGCVP